MPFRQTALAAAAIVTTSLGACQNLGSSASLNGSPEGVPIQFESIDGPPAPVKTALAGELSMAARERKGEMAGAGMPARYRVRGYVSTETTADGEPALTFVWDVFDADKRRAKRITGSSPIRSAGAKSWSGLDKQALAQLAAQSMNEIAGFLSQAPTQMASAASVDGAALPESFAAQ
jgi:hypothetical protein